ncbi:MAG: molybdate ABC transporter permease subunit [Albidovulum sp.]|nr:molybdate ABC transporter permease subunit [Albidovulum sp.]MDE0531070.1 molybdate ABC transporter permease subunit [Albidovulum sp.]
MIDFGSVEVSLKLATASTLLLLFIATPLSWWLANTKWRIKPIVEAVTALPLVLPPTVLGFYLLILFNPNSVAGSLWLRITGDTLAFSFVGILIATVIHSLPFAVQPLQAAFESVGRRPVETAASLGANPLDAFATVAVPLAKRGFLTAAVLGFAHSLGEFGVVLMVGGNIPDKTRVISIDIYTSVEVLDYRQAHILSIGMLCFSFVVLAALFVVNRRYSLNDEAR